MAFELKSPAFAQGGDIPAKHTCDGADRSPALRWSDPPAGAREFALIADDPDTPGGTWVHWVIYGVPAAARELPEGVAARDTVPGVATQGGNDFRRVGYGGPCPPPGPAHRYSFLSSLRGRVFQQAARCCFPVPGPPDSPTTDTVHGTDDASAVRANRGPGTVNREPTRRV